MNKKTKRKRKVTRQLTIRITYTSDPTILDVSWFVGLVQGAIRSIEDRHQVSIGPIKKVSG